jgi:putative zinc finger protein
MTTFNLTCDAVEATLADYIDETLEPWLRQSIEHHLSDCVRCSTLARELRAITREAAALPAFFPESDVWPRVARRIGAPVVVEAPAEQSEPLEEPEEAIGFAPDEALRDTELVPVRSEPEMLSSEAPVIANEASVLTVDAPTLESEPEVLPSESAVIPSEASLLENESALLTNEAAVLTNEPAVVRVEPSQPTTEPSVVAHEPQLFATDPSVLITESTLGADETPPPTSEPVTQTGEPAVPATSQRTVPTTVLFPVRPPRNWAPLWMGVAAAALVLATAGTTFLFTVRWVKPAATSSVASAEGTPSAASRAKGPAEPRTRGRPEARERVSSDSTTFTPGAGEPPSALAVASSSGSPVSSSPEDAVYDSEIDVLQRIVQRQKAHLDTSTTSVIEKNLGALDSAIAQIRSALKKDPQSSLLDDQASRALQMKVELLRRTALLRSSTI